MFKSTQFKIILVFFLANIIIVGGLAVFFMNSLDYLNLQIVNGQVQNLEQVSQTLVEIIAQTKNSVIIAGILFALIGIATAAILSKFVIYPINKLIKSAERISEEDKNLKKSFKSKRGNEAHDLENVINEMTTELKEKLSEVSTQKNQIETILLHMTDGIIAFNMEGEIILINPAAKKFLSIAPEDNTFEDIFKKFNLDINMEKIIYLENWTSTEQRIQVD